MFVDRHRKQASSGTGNEATMDKESHSIVYVECNYLTMPDFNGNVAKLIHAQLS